MCLSSKDIVNLIVSSGPWKSNPLKKGTFKESSWQLDSFDNVEKEILINWLIAWCWQLRVNQLCLVVGAVGLKFHCAIIKQKIQLLCSRWSCSIRLKGNYLITHFIQEWMNETGFVYLHSPPETSLWLRHLESYSPISGGNSLLGGVICSFYFENRKANLSV